MVIPMLSSFDDKCQPLTVTFNPHRDPGWKSQAGDAVDVAGGGDGGHVGIHFLVAGGGDGRVRIHFLVKKNFKMGSKVTKDYRKVPPVVHSQAGAGTQMPKLQAWLAAHSVMLRNQNISPLLQVSSGLTMLNTGGKMNKKSRIYKTLWLRVWVKESLAKATPEVSLSFHSQLTFFSPGKEGWNKDQS